MRTIERTNQFKRDYKRELKGQHRTTPDKDFIEVVILLANDLPMPERYRDHALTGDWKDFRDYHIKPDMVLIYQKTDDMIFRLTRIGSHSQLGL